MRRFKDFWLKANPDRQMRLTEGRSEIITIPASKFSPVDVRFPLVTGPSHEQLLSMVNSRAGGFLAMIWGNNWVAWPMGNAQHFEVHQYLSKLIDIPAFEQVVRIRSGQQFYLEGKPVISLLQTVRRGTEDLPEIIPSGSKIIPLPSPPLIDIQKGQFLLDNV